MKRRHLPDPVSRKGNRWTFASESRPHVLYTTLREGSVYKCGCKARGLCWHVRRAVMDDAKPRWGRVQIFTDEAKAKRQKNRVITMTVKGKPFYVVYARRKLDLDNPDVKAVLFVGPWTTPSSELVFDWKTDRVIVPGLALLDEAARRGWHGGSRGRFRQEIKQEEKQ